MTQQFILGNTTVTITPVKKTTFIEVVDVTVECGQRRARTITTNSMALAIRIKEHAFRDEMRCRKGEK
jgi:hypothetical protein